MGSSTRCVLGRSQEESGAIPEEPSMSELGEKVTQEHHKYRRTSKIHIKSMESSSYIWWGGGYRIVSAKR